MQLLPEHSFSFSATSGAGASCESSSRDRSAWADAGSFGCQQLHTGWHCGMPMSAAAAFGGRAATTATARAEVPGARPRRSGQRQASWVMALTLTLSSGSARLVDDQAREQPVARQPPQRVHQLAALHELLGRDVEQLARGRGRAQLGHDRAALAHALLRAQVRGRHAPARQLQQRLDLPPRACRVLTLGSHEDIAAQCPNTALCCSTRGVTPAGRAWQLPRRHARRLQEGANAHMRACGARGAECIGGHLVLHQGEQRRDDHSDAPGDDRRQLVAQGLACARARARQPGGPAPAATGMDGCGGASVSWVGVAAPETARWVWLRLCQPYRV